MRRRGAAVDVMLYCLAMLVIGAGAAGLYDVMARPGLAGSARAAVAFLRPPLAGVQQLNIMLVGSDDRDDRKDLGGRSDTLMILYVNPQTKRAAVLSIPRDLKVAIPGHGETKINHSYAFGKIPLLKQTVEGFMGEKIDCYAHANFETFVRVVDMLGGVDINVPDFEGKGRGMNYDCPGDGLVIHLFPGPQHLTGYKAMGFVRYRHSNVPGKSINDSVRASNQQMFLKAITEQKLHATNLPRLLRTAGYIMRTIDTDIPWNTGVDLARLLKSINSADLMTATVPTVDAPSGGVYYSVVAQSDFATIREQIRQHLAGGSTAASANVEVLNGSGVTGLATTASQELTQNGFKVLNTGNAKTFGRAVTLIEYKQGSEETAKNAAGALGVTGAELRAGSPQSLGQLDLRITVGKDVRAQPILEPTQ